MHSIHFFAGGNTARGFFSCFESIVPRAQRKRMFFIKGGPGVGKSTLMKRVAQAAEERGQQVIHFHCSSDPSSLDGISLPDHGFGMMDGTAPHVYDPAVPGARDTLLSLGDFLDERALAPRAPQIGALQASISARFARCYRYLAAAEQVLQANPLAQEHPRKVMETADQWTKLLPLRGGYGSIQTLFASAFTPKGLVTATDFSQFERCITLDVPFGAHATSLMHEMARRAALRGLHAIELLDPLIPERVSHVVIPAHSVAFCTGTHTENSSGEWTAAEDVFDLSDSNDHEQGFDRNASELLCQRAVEQLSAAKALHDDLEKHYAGHMDFEKWQTVLNRVLAELP